MRWLLLDEISMVKGKDEEGKTEDKGNKIINMVSIIYSSIGS